MNTFILILMIGGDGKALEKVEGYTSVDECRQAGTVYVNTDPRASRNYVCIPAPKSK